MQSQESHDYMDSLGFENCLAQKIVMTKPAVYKNFVASSKVKVTQWA